MLLLRKSRKGSFGGVSPALVEGAFSSPRARSSLTCHLSGRFTEANVPAGVPGKDTRTYR